MIGKKAILESLGSVFSKAKADKPEVKPKTPKPQKKVSRKMEKPLPPKNVVPKKMRASKKKPTQEKEVKQKCARVLPWYSLECQMVFQADMVSIGKVAASHPFVDRAAKASIHTEADKPDKAMSELFKLQEGVNTELDGIMSVSLAFPVVMVRDKAIRVAANWSSIDCIINIPKSELKVPSGGLAQKDQQILLLNYANSAAKRFKRAIGFTYK